MYRGKLIYNPSGKANEYSYWACNSHIGCDHGCTYCYLKKGRGAKTLGGDIPRLKKPFETTEEALIVFGKELKKNIDELQKHGLFFSFTTDPLIGAGCFNTPYHFTTHAVKMCTAYGVPVKILTKCGGFDLVYSINNTASKQGWDKDLVAFGFTLTGHDELEPNASANDERIQAMKGLKESGYKTFASIEPIISFSSSHNIISDTIDFCDLYKIGFEAGRTYNSYNTRIFVQEVNCLCNQYGKKVYWKDSITKKYSEESDCIVSRDYNLFNK